MYEGQGHKLSNFKMKEKGIINLFKPFLWRVAEDGKKKTNMVMKKKVSFIDTKALTNDEYKFEGQCQGHKCTVSKKAKKQ